MMTAALSQEAEAIVKKIEKYREEHPVQIIEPSELVSLFSSPRDQSIILSADEVASILSSIAGRDISNDYVKRLRLSERLPAKRLSERAYAFRLSDVLLVRFKERYKNRPPGRPRKNKDD